MANKVDLSTNSKDLRSIVDLIQSGSSEADWALFGYVGQTDTLKLTDQGDDGIDGISREVNEGQVQYAYLRVVDTNSKNFKFVFIIWQGDGAKASRKGASVGHSRDVEIFLKAVHITVNARSQVDLDKTTIMKNVAKAAGANYSVHNEKKVEKFSGNPDIKVGSTYTNAYSAGGLSAEPQAQRDAYWAKQRAEEAERLQAEQAKKESEKKMAETERKERERERAALVEKKANDLEVERVRAAEARKSAPAPESTPVVQAVELPTARVPNTAPVPTSEVLISEDSEDSVQVEESVGGAPDVSLRAKALYDYQAAEDGELTFDPDEIIENINQLDEGWWQGTCRGITGLFPANYVALL